VFQPSCSKDTTLFTDPPHREEDGGEGGAPSGGNSGTTITKGGNTSSGSDSGGSTTGGTSTGGSSSGGEAGANDGGTQTGGASGSMTGGEAGDGGEGNTGGTTGPMSGAGGVAGGGGMAGVGGAAGASGTSGAGGAAGASGISGAGGAAGIGGIAGAGGRAGAGGAAGGGMAGRAGGGSSGSSGQVEFRADSFRMTTTDAPVARAPAIRGQDGLLLAHIVYDSASSTSDAENFGFEHVTTATRTIGEIIVLHVFWKIAAGAAGQPTTEPTSYAITNAQNRYQNLLLFAVFGHDATMPIAGSATASGGGTAMSVSGVDVARAGSLGLWWKAGYNSSTVANPSGWTMIAQDQDDVNDVARHAFGVGPTGPVTSVQLLSDAWANVLVVVQPP